MVKSQTWVQTSALLLTNGVMLCNIYFFKAPFSHLKEKKEILIIRLVAPS